MEANGYFMFRKKTIYIIEFVKTRLIPINDDGGGGVVVVVVVVFLVVFIVLLIASHLSLHFTGSQP